MSRRHSGSSSQSTSSARSAAASACLATPSTVSVADGSDDAEGRRRRAAEGNASPDVVSAPPTAIFLMPERYGDGLAMSA